VFRLLAFDLDDTLLMPSGKLSERTRVALNELNRHGVIIALCSGRMLTTMLPIAEELDFDPAIVSFNGAQVNLSSEQPPLYHCPVPAALAEHVLDWAMERQLHLMFYHDNRAFVPELDTWKTRYYREQTGADLELETNYDRFRGMEPTKLLVVDEPEKIVDLLVECSAKFGHELTVTRSKPSYLEILNPQVNKGEGFKALCKALDIPLEATAAFGDAPNDLEMLQACGTAIVVENADAEIRTVASRVIAPNHEEGVAQYLEELLTTIDSTSSLTESSAADVL
jgi:Cof subfamily protein (haloacid dehalogenase superfamily)